MKRTLKTLLFLSCLFVFCCANLQAQLSYMHSGGGSLLVVRATENNITRGIGMPALTYNPRLNLAFSPEFSFSATSYPSISAVGFFSGDGGNEGTIGLDVPVLAQLNFGQHATPESDFPIGGYVAVGWGYTLIAGSSDIFPNYGGSSVGPTADVGFKFRIFKNSFCLRAKYMLDVLQDNPSDVIAFSFLYNLPGK